VETSAFRLKTKKPAGERRRDWGTFGAGAHNMLFHFKKGGGTGRGSGTPDRESHSVENSHKGRGTQG